MTMTVADASIAQAVPTFQRLPEKPLPYPLTARLLDWWAGFRDRAALPTSERRIDTPWLRRLSDECSTALEGERRGALAVIASIDETIAAHECQIELAHAELNAVADDQDTLSGVEVNAAAVTAAEQFDTPEQRLLRRRRSLAARREVLVTRELAARGKVEQSRLAIGTLTSARQAHWTMLQVRCCHLLAHYNRRAASYTRSVTRRRSEPFDIPTVAQPGWVVEASASGIGSVDRG